MTALLTFDTVNKKYDAKTVSEVAGDIPYFSSPGVMAVGGSSGKPFSSLHTSRLGVSPGGSAAGNGDLTTVDSGLAVDLYLYDSYAGGTKKIINEMSAVAGDVTGTHGATTVAKIQGRAVHNGAPSDSNVLKWVAANNRWEPSALSGIADPVSKSQHDLLQWNGSAWDAKGGSGDRVTGPLFMSTVDLAGHLTFTADNTYDIGASGATRPRTIYAGTSIYQGTHQVVDKDTAGAIALNSAQGVTLSTTTSASLGAYIWQANELLLSSTLHWTFAFAANNNSQTYRIYLDYWNGSTWSTIRDVGAINNSTGTIFFYDVYVTTNPRDNARVLCWGRGSTGQITYLDDRELFANFFTTANRGLRITARKVSDSYTGYASGIMREMRGG